MKAQVTEEGVWIPRDWLEDAQEVEIYRENGHVVVTPLPQNGQPTPEKATEPDEPLYELGSEPISLGIPDASINHDRYRRL